MSVIEEVRPRVFKRVGFHSHIKGLGLDESGKAKRVADGMVGQEEAREAAGIVVQMIREGKMAGRGILLVGPSGTGKTALAVAIARELGEDTPFVEFGGSEVFSTDLKKTELLMQTLRKAIGVRLREKRLVYEGVVKDLKVRRVSHPFNPYLKIPREAKITLETKDDSLTLTVTEEIARQLIQEGVRINDVIWLDAETGRVFREGRVRGDGGYDVSAVRIVEMPRGPVKKEKEIVNTVTLHDLDVYVASKRVGLELLLGFAAPREIGHEVRKMVDEEVKRLVESRKAEMVPGVLFIDDAHMLDLETFSFLSEAMESELAPILILATNRGFTKIRGTDLVSPHGIPLDLLDRLLIIVTRPYTRDEIREILMIRADEEEVPLEKEALERLADVGIERSLRYAVQLLEPARIIAARKGRPKVTVEDVEEAARLFLDLKRSTEYVAKHEELMLK
ncbi:MAG: RuvB-like domain-containing protein [Fervidicoccaceae archaeon]